MSETASSTGESKEPALQPKEIQIQLPAGLDEKQQQVFRRVGCSTNQPVCGVQAYRVVLAQQHAFFAAHPNLALMRAVREQKLPLIKYESILLFLYI